MQLAEPRTWLSPATWANSDFSGYAAYSGRLPVGDDLRFMPSAQLERADTPRRTTTNPQARFVEFGTHNFRPVRPEEWSSFGTYSASLLELFAVVVGVVCLGIRAGFGF